MIRNCYALVGIEGFIMARLPIPDQDDGTWGTILNDFLEVELNSDGTLKIRSDGTLPVGLSELQSISISSPSNSQVLTYNTTDGAWENQTSSSSPGGNNTDIQFNNSGSFGGSNNLQFDGSNLSLSSGNITINGGGTNILSGTTNSADSTLDDGSGNMTVGGSLIVSGSLTDTSGSTLDDGAGNMTIAGTLSQQISLISGTQPIIGFTQLNITYRDTNDYLWGSSNAAELDPGSRTGTLAGNLSSGPVSISAGNTVVTNVTFDISNLSASTSLSSNYLLTVSDANAINTYQLSGGIGVNGPDDVSITIDDNNSTPTTTGSDLTFSDEDEGVVSTNGGTYFVTVLFATNWPD